MALEAVRCGGGGFAFYSFQWAEPTESLSNLQRRWMCVRAAAACVSVRNKRHKWEKQRACVADRWSLSGVVPHLSLSDSLLGPTSSPLSPLQSLTSSFFFPSPLSSTPFPSSSSSVKPGLGSSLTVLPLIFSLSLPLFPSSATSLLIFCWQHQLENIKRFFFSECHSGPCWHSTKDTEEIWGFVWGSKRGKLERKDWQIWPANQSELKLPGKHWLN